jgi:hypothetical protein
VLKHRGVVLGSVAAVALLFASGCPVYVPQQTTGNPPPPTVVTGAPASLVISNASNEAVYYIHMSQSVDPSWGPDLLGSDQTLDIGAQFTITGVAAGQWDVAVFDGTGNCKLFMQESFEAGQTYTLDVTSDGWTPPDQCPAAH